MLNQDNGNVRGWVGMHTDPRQTPHVRDDMDRHDQPRA
jgi:hypothetical protein